MSMVYYLTECMRDLLNILFSIIRFILATLTIAAIIIEVIFLSLCLCGQLWLPAILSLLGWLVSTGAVVFTGS